MAPPIPKRLLKAAGQVAATFVGETMSGRDPLDALGRSVGAGVDSLRASTPKGRKRALRAPLEAAAGLLGITEREPSRTAPLWGWLLAVDGEEIASTATEYQTREAAEAVGRARAELEVALGRTAVLYLRDRDVGATELDRRTREVWRCKPGGTWQRGKLKASALPSATSTKTTTGTVNGQTVRVHIEEPRPPPRK